MCGTKSTREPGQTTYHKVDTLYVNLIELVLELATHEAYRLTGGEVFWMSPTQIAADEVSSIRPWRKVAVLECLV